MEIRYPEYYHRFACLAGACPDSCCHEWEVDVDPETAAMYRALSGPLGDRLREVLREGEDGWASMTITADRRCPMWREDGLCRIQAELEHDALCDTCRNFPRLRHEYPDFTELGLEMSCPEAARIILNEDPVWVTEYVEGGSGASCGEDELEVLLASREQARKLLGDHSIPTGKALAGLLLYAYQIQYSADPRDVWEFDLEDRLADVGRFLQPGDLDEILGVYRDLEILTDRWQKLLRQGTVDALWTDRHRRLARYFVDRYWLQAVSDGELALRVKFIVTSCLVIRGLGGELTETAQLYSKEIENDADNVDALLDAMDTSRALTDVRLLELLLR